MRGRPIVVYDDQCAFCTRSIRMLQRLDWLRRLDRLGYSQAVQRYPEIGRGALGDGLRVRFADGSVAVGVDAVRSAAIRTPLGALGAWTLYVPGLHALGARAYAALAARRMRLGGSCELPAAAATGEPTSGATADEASRRRSTAHP
jgi:predicted DCC family thiol-disulfide oxidoreductase YuxK